MTLDPQVAAFLGRLAEIGAPRYGEEPPDVTRRAMDEGAAGLFGPFPAVPFEDREIDGPHGPVPVRIYRPAQPSGVATVWFHGGGWVIGSITSAHPTCSRLADTSGATIVSVDYRLAPEHRFPAAVDDAWAAMLWVHENREALGATGPLTVGGDSAGGNLAAVLARRARDAGIPVALQILIYPVTDAALDTPSYTENAEGYWLTRAGMVYFWEEYIPEGDRFHPDASPLRADDLSGLAPAVVITAEYDPLRDEGEAYAQRLKDAGVQADLRRYDGMVHGFFRTPAVIDRSNEALDQVSDALRAAAGAG